MSIVLALDLLSTFVFALVGARVAADRRMDYGGITLIAAIAAIAGGTLRNVFLNERPIWLTNPWVLASIVVAVSITIAMRTTKPIGKYLLVLDTFGLAFATISGTQFSLTHGAPKYAAAILGMITAVTGGLLRDILCQVEPVLLHRETIGTSCLIGSIAYVLLDYSSLNSLSTAILSGITVFAVRGISIYFDINLPKIKN
jgi:uncharacterized membrane protein YeiH